MKEIWKDVDNYKGMYMVSNHGRVKSMSRDIYNRNGTFSRRSKEKIKAQGITKDGYPVVYLSEVSQHG